MNKQELRERINLLPLFEKRKVKVATSTNDDADYKPQKKLAICETDGEEAYAYVGEGYTIVQFKDVFNPIIDQFDCGVEGNVVTHEGYAYMTAFPEMEQLKDGKSRFGLVAINSVDLSASVIVKFCVEHNGRRVTIPADIAGFKKQHTKNVGTVAKDYISMVGKVKDVWHRIITGFPKYEILNAVKEDDPNAEYQLTFSDVTKDLKLGSRLSKFLRERMDKIQGEGNKFTLWDLFELVFEKIAEKDYKSGVHKAKKIDTICQSVFHYAISVGI